MNIAHEKSPTTYEEYCSLPDDERYELIGGELYVTPSPSSFHRTISLNIAHLLLQHVRENNLGTVLDAPMDVKLSETDVVQPDVLFVRNEREEIVREDYVDAGPDLVVEVVSEGSRDRDTVLKRNLYFRHGVEEYWLVYPEDRTTTVLTRNADGFEIHTELAEDHAVDSPLLPQFSPSVDRFFEK